MQDILAKIVDKKRARIEEKKKAAPLAHLSVGVAQANHRPSFSEALRNTQRMNVIAEIKRASPSAGLLRDEFDPAAMAAAYEENGAAAISVLTEQDFFLGDVEHLKKVSERVHLPVLRKDFIIDEYQIYESLPAGASAVLLIVALLDQNQLKGFLELSAALGLEALVEAHTLDEVHAAIDAGARIIGINNRDLKTFQVTLATSLELVKSIPRGTIKISESGIKTREDLARLRQAGFDGVLIGEQLMRDPNPGAALKKLW
jgi:indole-3-glycerol phosphate synthase